MKHITSKLLSLLLCLAMLMSMVPAAYADVETEGASGKNTPTETNGGASEQDDAYDDAPDTAVVQSTAAATTYAAKVGEVGYATLAEAITAAEDDATVTLLADRTEDVTITKSITLDLGGKTLTNTNAGKATISVTGGAVTVKNGTVTGAASYYNIEVTKGSNANLTLENVTATAGNTGSSMIDNWGTLTINSGDYSGGLNVVKSEEGSTLTINGGKFTLSYATDGYTGVIFAYGDTTISGGEFIQNLTTTGRWNHPQVILAGVAEGYTSRVKVTGGSFTNKMSRESIFRGVGKANSDNFEVSGGTFNKSISDGYCADGFIPTKNADGTYGVKEGKYVAQIGDKKYETLADAIRLAAKGKTVTLLNDVDLSGNIVINKNITLDLNGKKIYNTTDIWHDANENDENDKNIVAMFDIKNGADVTITGNGTVEAKQNDCYNFNIVKGNLTIENGTFMGNVSAVQVQNGHLAIKGGKFDLLQKWDGKSTFLINCIDDAYRDGTAKVSITGGTFVDFNPANCKAEGAGTNFLASGYVTKKVGDNYVVKANDNQTIKDLETAITTIKEETDKGESSNNTKVSTAVDVIKNIDNADLANNSAAMGKLAALDNTLTTKNGETGKAKVTVTSNSTATGINSHEVTVTNAALSADLTSKVDQKVVVTIANGSADDAAVAAAKDAAGGAANAGVQKLNISMKVNNETVTEPTAPVVLEFPLPEGWKGCQIVCVDDANKPELVPTTVINNKVKATFNHFSEYVSVQSQVITSPNKYQINLTPSNSNQTTVYAGDTITFNVELEQTGGNFDDTISYFRFKPESDMLEVASAALKNSFKFNSSDGTITAINNEGTALNNKKLELGTITFKVKGYGVQNTALKVSADEESAVTAPGGKYTIGAGLTVTMPQDVTYDIIRVYFNNYNDGEAGTTVITRYASKNSKDLYASLSDLESRDTNKIVSAPEAKDGSITDGAQYRLKKDEAGKNLENWVDANGSKYLDVTGFTSTINYHVDRVELLKVDTLPEGVEITSKTTKRTGIDAGTYVDKNENFTFTAPVAGTGKKNEVTVSVGADTNVKVPTESDLTGDTSKKSYEVQGSEMSTSPVKISITQVVDLTKDDIKVFASTDGGYKKYSTYSDTDTLVLIKGVSGVKYTLSNAAGAPEIYAIPDNAYGTGFNLAVLIPAPTQVNANDDLREVMLEVLKNTYNISVEDDTNGNTSIGVYDFDTNGVKSFKIDDVQAAYDFSQLPPGGIAWTPSDNLLLKADVLNYSGQDGEYNIPRDGQVIVSDVDAFLYSYAGYARN